ncbi:MAG: hypothetical protein ACXADB_03910, partial [Candidatus Hermodarchaeia archaeon]
MSQYDPLIGLPILDKNGTQLGFIDPKTSRASLKIDAKPNAIIVIQIDSKASNSSYDQAKLEDSVYRYYKDERRIFDRASKYFGATDFSLNAALFMSLLSVENKKVPMQDIPRKLVITTRKHIQKRGRDLIVDSLIRTHIPGWTDTLDRVNVTSYFGIVTGPIIFTHG